MRPKVSDLGSLLERKMEMLLVVVTNYHVVEDANLSVGFIDDESASATVRGYDSDADLAVVEVNTKDMKSST